MSGFQKSAADYACSTLTLLRSRIQECRDRTGERPRQLVIHVPMARALFSEYAAAHGLPMPPERWMRGGSFGAFEGTPFAICDCGHDLGEDQLTDKDGNTEPI
jgi:hypothetical protein